MNVNKLHQIILLRKLRIPVKQIFDILNSRDAVIAIDVFKHTIGELNDEISALSTIRSILNRLIEELHEKTNIQLKLNAINDEAILSMIDSLSLSKNYIKEEKSMEDLVRANKKLTELKDVRIVYLPPMTVASSHYVGENPEDNAGKVLDEFVRKNNLTKIKPDLRHIGFNNPAGNPNPGYEMWVSIPDDMEVAPPLVKKQFHGGLYAAHAIAFPNFDDWMLLLEWVNDSDKYDGDMGDIRCTPHTPEMDWAFEEHLNYINNVHDPDFNVNTMQLDLLLPIKLSEVKDESIVYIQNSESICGYKAGLMSKDKFKIVGYTKILMDNMTEGDFKNEIISAGRLESIKSNLKEGAPILGFGSFDSECRKCGGRYRYTICVDENDVIDKKKFKMPDFFSKNISASKWIRFEMSSESFFTKFKEENAHHHLVKKLGYSFNGPVSGHFDVYPDGIIEYEPKNKESTVYFWMPVQ